MHRTGGRCCDCCDPRTFIQLKPESALKFGAGARWSNGRPAERFRSAEPAVHSGGPGRVGCRRLAADPGKRSIAVRVGEPVRISQRTCSRTKNNVSSRSSSRIRRRTDRPSSRWSRWVFLRTIVHPSGAEAREMAAAPRPRQGAQPLAETSSPPISAGRNRASSASPAAPRGTRSHSRARTSFTFCRRATGSSRYPAAASGRGSTASRRRSRPTASGASPGPNLTGAHAVVGFGRVSG